MSGEVGLPHVVVWGSELSVSFRSGVRAEGGDGAHPRFLYHKYVEVVVAL